MKNLIKIAFITLVVMIFTVEVRAEKYDPISIGWDRPTETEDGDPIGASVPLVYDIYCDIDAGQSDVEFLCADNISAESFTFNIDDTRTGLDSGEVLVRGKTCYEGTEVCSEFSNVVSKLIKKSLVAPKPQIMR